MSWNDERVDLLKKMWGEGQSASQIARELGGVTRNAVIGKVHRLGLSNRNGAAEGPRPEEPVAIPEPVPEPEPVAAVPEPEPVQAELPPRRQIVPAGQPLPPQPSQNEISPE